MSLVTLGLALFPVIELPTRAFSFVILGSTLTIQLSETWIMAALLVGLTGSGSDAVIRSHPLTWRKGISSTFVFWILPGLSVLLATLLLPLAPSRLYWLGGLALTGFLLSLVMAAQYHTVDPADPRHGLARWILDIVAYAAALVLFIIVYGGKMLGLLPATTMMVVSGLLTLELLRSPAEAHRSGTRCGLRRTGLYALISGAVMGEIAWALNYEKTGGLSGGVLLLLIFYLVTNLARRGLLGELHWRALVEFALVTLIGLGLLAWNLW